jgi:NTE family protein
MTERDAVRIRRLLLVVVDASRGPNGDWMDKEDGPAGMDLALSATDAAVDSAARQAADAFDAMIHEWQDALVAYRCALKPEDIARLGGPASWNCRDVRFTVAHLEVHDLQSPLRERIESIPTRLTLEPADIDAAIEGGVRGTLALPQLWQYLSSRAAP